MAPGLTIPELGRTQYFFGEVVLTLKATGSLPGLCRERVTGMLRLSSNLNLSSEGLSCRCSVITPQSLLDQDTAI